MCFESMRVKKCSEIKVSFRILDGLKLYRNGTIVCSKTFQNYPLQYQHRLSVWYKCLYDTWDASKEILSIPNNYKILESLIFFLDDYWSEWFFSDVWAKVIYILLIYLCHFSWDHHLSNLEWFLTRSATKIISNRHNGRA